MGTRRAVVVASRQQLRGWVRAVTAHGVRGDAAGADSVPAELYQEDKAAGSAARTSGLQKAGWKTVCRRERASEALTLPLRPAVEGHVRQKEQNGAKAPWKKPGLGRWSLAFGGTENLCNIRRQGFILYCQSLLAKAGS